MTPRLAPHVRLRADRARGGHVLLGPERALFPDEIALAVLSKCTGEATVEEIVDALCAEFEAPREVVAADVRDLLAELARGGWVATT